LGSTQGEKDCVQGSIFSGIWNRQRDGRRDTSLPSNIAGGAKDFAERLASTKESALKRGNHGKR